MSFRGPTAGEATLVLGIGVVLGIILFVALSALFAYPLMAAWNGSMPAMFGLPTIGWDEAFWAQVVLLFIRGLPIRLNRS